MNPFEAEQILKTMTVLHDTREQQTDQARRRYKAFGVPTQKAVLDYGDYTYNVTLPEGDLYDTKSRIFPRCAVERKMNLDELAMCFTRERKRFAAEMQRASDHGARIYLLVEDATWENLLNGKYRSRFNASAFSGSLAAWTVRYNLVPIFCKAESSGPIIREILYRDLKERLNNGEFEQRMDKSTSGSS